MAHIYVGNRSMVDQEVLAAVERLSDEFWVCAEFDIGRRNVDWLILREVPEERPPNRFSTVILTELKRTKAVLEGGDYGSWREQRNGVWDELQPSNMRDENPFRQLINTVNELRDWLYNNQRRFLDLDQQQLYPPALVKIWPNLLILSDQPGANHKLPLKPQNNFGAYHYDLADWFVKTQVWAPTAGLQLTAAELESLARALNLRLLPTDPAAVVDFAAPEWAVTTEPVDEENEEAIQEIQRSREIEAIGHSLAASPDDGSLAWLDGFTRWASGIEERLRRLEERVEGLRPHPKPEPVDRPLAPEERSLIQRALNNIRLTGKGRTFAVLFSEMHRLGGGGPTFKQRDFNGFGGAKAMMDQALQEGIVQYGANDPTGMPLVYLPDEAVPGQPAPPAPPPAEGLGTFPR